MNSLRKECTKPYLNQRNAAVLALLQNNVVLGVGFRKLVDIRGRQLERMLALDVGEDAVQDALEHGARVEHDQVGHPGVLLLGRLGAQQHGRLDARRHLERVADLVGVRVVDDLHLADEEALLEPALRVALVHRALAPRVRLAQNHQAVEQEDSALGQPFPRTHLVQDVLCNSRQNCRGF